MAKFIVLVICLLRAISAACAAESSEFLARADAAKIRQDYKTALPLYRQAVKLQPQNSDAHAGLGWVLFSLGQQKVGLLEAEKAIRLDQQNPLAHHHLGTIYWMLNRPADAAAQFRIEYAIDPKRNCHCGPMESLLAAYPAVSKDKKTKN